MKLTIYHNPRCSKSRNTLAIIREAGIEPAIVLYLQDTPTAAELLKLAGALRLPVAGLLRRGESAFMEATDLPAIDDDDALADWLAAHPIVLQRPIIVDDATGRAVVGRPPDNVRELLG